jgi:hypothetical protein
MDRTHVTACPFVQPGTPAPGQPRADAVLAPSQGAASPGQAAQTVPAGTRAADGQPGGEEELGT